MPLRLGAVVVATLLPVSAGASDLRGSSPAAADSATLLQIDPVRRADESLKSWKMKNTVKDAKAFPNPDLDPSARIVGVASDFEVHPGYQGELEVFGSVTVKAFTGNRPSVYGVHLSYEFLDADRECRKGPGSSANSCGVQIRTARSCGAELGKPFYNKQARARDPWKCVAYISELPDEANLGLDQDTTVLASGRSASSGASGSATPSARGCASVLTGEDPDAVKGKVVVVYNYGGEPLACAKIQTPDGVEEEEPEVPEMSLVSLQSHGLRPMKADNFVKYPGYAGESQVWGQVLIHSRFSVTSSITGQLLTWDLEGVDRRCDKGPGGHDKNSCGIHIHKGKSCKSATGGDDYLSWAVHKNPWHCVTYTALVGSRVVVATGKGLPAMTGKETVEMVGQTAVVYDFDGKPMGCSIIEVI